MKSLLIPTIAAACLCASCLHHVSGQRAEAPTVSSVEVEQRRLALIGRLAALPPYLVHEETPQAFHRQLYRGNFCYDAAKGTSYLNISGDGTFGRRLFIEHRDRSLEVIMNEGGHAELYRYNTKEQCLEQLSVTLQPITESAVTQM